MGKIRRAFLDHSRNHTIQSNLELPGDRKKLEIMSSYAASIDAKGTESFVGDTKYSSYRELTVCIQKGVLRIQLSRNDWSPLAKTLLRISHLSSDEFSIQTIPF